MTTATATVAAPVKGTVFTVNSTSTRYQEWDGVPRQYTVTTVRGGKVYGKDRYGNPLRASLENFASRCLVQSVPEDVEKDLGPIFTATQAARLRKKAHEAGLAAGKAVTPVPMVVVQRKNPLDDTSKIVRQYAPTEGGVCGFAYVTVRPGTGSFARHARKAGWRAAYYGGTQMSVHAFGQSLERKQAYAAAYAAVLREAGVKAYVETRMD